MKETRGKITSRVGSRATVEMDMGEGASGVQCPYCEMYFVVIATDALEHPMRPIPCSGQVDYFCPCCGKNLKKALADMIKAG